MFLEYENSKTKSKDRWKSFIRSGSEIPGNCSAESTFTGNDKTTCFYKSKLFYAPHFHISEEKLLQKQENRMFCENKLLLN